MTISEYLREQTRTINTAKWVGIGVAVIAAFVSAFLKQSRAATYAWISAPMLPAVAVMLWIGRRLRCPRCKADLRQQLMVARGRVQLRFCPHCGADFSEQMPENPIGQ